MYRSSSSALATSHTAGGSGAGTGAAWTVGWSALKSGLVGASASGPVLPIDGACFGLTCAGAAPVFGGFAAGGGTLPIGATCASAGPAPTPTSMLVNSNVRQASDIDLNLFI